jgi:hypothetical protein
VPWKNLNASFVTGAFGIHGIHASAAEDGEMDECIASSMVAAV